MTREQESDSTFPPEKEEMAMETPSPRQLGERGGHTGPLNGRYVPPPVMSPREVICSFCGVDTHGYKDCPVMHQYIREQADALTQKRLEEYQQL